MEHDEHENPTFQVMSLFPFFILIIVIVVGNAVDFFFGRICHSIKTNISEFNRNENKLKIDISRAKRCDLFILF